MTREENRSVRPKILSWRSKKATNVPHKTLIRLLVRSHERAVWGEKKKIAIEGMEDERRMRIGEGREDVFFFFPFAPVPARSPSQGEKNSSIYLSRSFHRPIYF